MAQLTASLGPLRDAEYVDDLSFTSEVLNRRAHVGRAPLSRHRRRQGHSSDLELQPVPPVCAQYQGGHVGPSFAVEDPTIGEKPPVRGPCRHGQRGLTDGVTLSVVVDLKMNFSILQKCLNSAVIGLFCIEINRAPKIMKIFV